MPAEVETVGIGTTLVMGLFLAIAVLIVVSIVCKILVAVGLVPRKRSSRLRRTIVWLADVVGNVSVVRSRSGQSRRNSGGGGSSGGAGASGKF